MVVRAQWRALVAEKEPYLASQVTELHGHSTSAPVSLTDIGDKLGAVIRPLPKDSHRSGSLSRNGSQWTVWVDGDPTRLSQRQRFTVAHELAHLLFLEAGVASPVGKSEYWILEEACNRIASWLLVPRSRGPSGALDTRAVGGWFRGLTQRWMLSHEAAAKMICQRSSNCLGVAGLQRLDDDKGLVRWSLSNALDKPWPAPRSHVDGERYPDLFKLLAVLEQGRGEELSVPRHQEVLIGIGRRLTCIAFLLSTGEASPATEDEQLPLWFDMNP